jgi:hypothetical protein
VIKVEDRRIAAPVSLEAVEPQLREQLAREALETVLNGLRGGVEIEIVSESPGENSGPPAAAAPAQ